MRYHAIDLLRTVAIVLMVTVHFLENLAGVNWAPAGFGAPLFGFLVGVSYRLWLQGQIARDVSDAAITRSTLRRGAMIFLLGLAFNVVVWLPEDAFNWDVLTLIGTALVVLGLIRDTPAFVPLTLALTLFVAGPVLRSYTGYEEYWAQPYYDYDWTVADIALGYLVNGYFPVVPWLLFPMVGFVAGAGVFPPDAKGGPTWRRVARVAYLGLAALAASLALRLARAFGTGPVASKLLGEWTMFPPSPEYLLGTTGGILLAFAACAWWIDGRGGLDRLPGVTSVARTMSRYSLSVYVLHHVAHVWPLWVVGWYTGKGVTDSWRKAAGWPVALALVPIFLVACYLLFRWVERGDRPTLESLLRYFSG